MARTVGIGHQDFEVLRKNNLFYVDKTDFIREWWENEDSVTLITRSRRFGKTLTMSMLEKFFSVNYADRTDLFESLLRGESVEAVIDEQIIYSQLLTRRDAIRSDQEIWIRVLGKARADRGETFHKPGIAIGYKLLLFSFTPLVPDHCSHKADEERVTYAENNENDRFYQFCLRRCGRSIVFSF